VKKTGSFHFNFKHKNVVCHRYLNCHFQYMNTDFGHTFNRNVCLTIKHFGILFSYDPGASQKMLFLLSFINVSPALLYTKMCFTLYEMGYKT
jgi:hypothetical protein